MRNFVKFGKILERIMAKIEKKNADIFLAFVRVF